MRSAARFATVLVAMLGLAGLAVLVAQEAGHELPEAWQSWRYSRAIELPSVGDDGFVSVEVPPEVYRNARATLSDLRVVDGGGVEVPYVLHSVLGRRSTEWLEASVLDTGTVAGEYTQVVVDAGTTGELHNSVKIETASSNFFARVEVAASDDRETWRTLAEDLPIYRFAADGIDGNQTLRYPNTRSRWLRIRVSTTEAEIPITGARLSRYTVKQAKRSAYGGTIEPLEAPDAPPDRQSGWQIEFDGANLPLSEIRFETKAAAFHRPIRIQYSDDGERWLNAGSGDIYRFPASGPRATPGRRESLGFEFGESQGRLWRVYVVNRDDPPIDDLSFTFYGVPRQVAFQPDAGKSHRLLYGNPIAAAPRYELTRLSSDVDLTRASEAHVSAEEENPAYVDPDPEPWSEQNRYVLWFGMLVAVAALGWLAIGSLRQTPPKQG